MPPRQVAGRSLLHRGEDSESPRAGSVARPGAQASGATLRAQTSGQPDPHGRQEADKLPQGGSPHHRQPPAGPITGFAYHSIHVAIDDTTRMANVEVLADEQQSTAIGFRSRPVAWITGKGFSLQQSDHGQGTRLRPK